MSIIVFIIVGILQGLFGLLPLSTAGLTSFFIKLFNIEGVSVIPAAAVLHFGTGIAILVVFRKTFFRILKGTLQIAASGFRNLWIYFKNNALGGL